MVKILILYFSGAGATKKVAEIMCTYLSHSQDCEVTLLSIEDGEEFNIQDYDAFIIGTPVYHAAPSRMIKSYFDNLSPLKKTTPAFIYNTRAMYSCNTNRILSKQILDKNIITIEDREYRSPASDGTLIVPFVRRLFEFEKNLYCKIKLDCNEFLTLLRLSDFNEYLPRFRFSGIINAPNKFAGQFITFKIYLHQDKCIKCGLCIRNCPHHALEKDEFGYPLYLIKKCENCYRCIHHCPVKALSLNKHRSPKELLAFEIE